MQFSIVICTYNPVRQQLEQVLNACIKQTLPISDFEIILIDNNSDKPLSSQPYISDLLASQKIKCFTEKQQGLVYARLLGIKNSVAPVIVFVDDDNLIEKDYLEKINILINQYPQVAVWGPGEINLDFPDGVPDWIKNNFGHLYQQKKLSETRWGNQIEWQNFYPAGSGLIVIRKVLEKYKMDFDSGIITATGRKGQSMASAEDSQIVWTAIKTGFQVGTSPLLKLRHIIPGSRTNLNYLCRLNYGISNSYYHALKEMFPTYELPYKKRNILNKLALLFRTIVKTKFNPVLSYRMYCIENSWLKGYDDYKSEAK